MKSILLVLLILTPLMVYASIIQVSLDGTQDFTSIQIAIHATADGDTILIHPGTYYENVEIIGRYLTIGSLELITADSTYVNQTVIDADQSGSCFAIWDYSIVTLQGLYMTNGIGTPDNSYNAPIGGAVYAENSDLSLINSMLIGNKAMSGAGIQLSWSTCYLAGTTIAHNYALSSGGGVNFGGYSTSSVPTLTFDPINRCSIYSNYAMHASDIFFGSQYFDNLDIYLDKFTVSTTSIYTREAIHLESYRETNYMTYNLVINEAVIEQQFSDFYVSPHGSDANSGLSPDEPMKTIALAILKIGADNLNHHTIHLANGTYGEEQHFPLNLRSYVNIIGESEQGVIFTGPRVFFGGWDGEKEVLIKNISIQATTDQQFWQTNLIHCISRLEGSGLNLFSLTLENISFRNCLPMDFNRSYAMIRFQSPGRLTMKDITIEDCIGSIGIYLTNGNTYAENVRINNFQRYPHGSIGGGTALGIVFLSTFDIGDNIFNNLEITNCNSNGGDNNVIRIFNALPNYQSFESYFINATIANNSYSSGNGSAVELIDGMNATFINSIIHNPAPTNVYLHTMFNPSRLRFVNSFVGSFEHPLDTVNNAYSGNIVEWYGDNLSGEPLFAGAVADNPFSLISGSPCIDAGTTDLQWLEMPDVFHYPEYDLIGNPRIYGDYVDMGAYEWQGQTDINDLVMVPTFSICNYPNPFTAFTNLKVVLPSNQCNDKAGVTSASIDIYNIKGQKVKSIPLDPGKAGEQFSYWDGRDEAGRQCSSGIYLLNLKVNGIGALSKKVTLVR